MRVLVTARARGSRSASRPGASRQALDGELVRPPMPSCGNHRCSCAGAWAGLVSTQAADTARVVDLDLQREGLLAAFADALFDIDGPGSDDPDQRDQPCPEWVAELVDQHLDLARSHPLDALVSLVDGQPAAARLPLSA
jgi:hypothetical protein